MKKSQHKLQLKQDHSYEQKMETVDQNSRKVIQNILHVCDYPTAARFCSMFHS